MTLRMPPRDESMSRDWRRWLHDIAVRAALTETPIYSGQFLGIGNFPELSLATVNGSLKARVMPTTTSLQSFSFTLPENFKPNSNVQPFLIYTPSDSGSGNIAFGFSMQALSFTTAVAAPTEQNKTVVASGTDDLPAQLKFDEAGSNTLQPKDTIAGYVGRKGSLPTDTYASDVYLYGVGFRYQVEGLGARKAF